MRHLEGKVRSSDRSSAIVLAPSWATRSPCRSASARATASSTQALSMAACSRLDSRGRLVSKRSASFSRSFSLSAIAAPSTFFAWSFTPPLCACNPCWSKLGRCACNRSHRRIEGSGGCLAGSRRLERERPNHAGTQQRSSNFASLGSSPSGSPASVGLSLSQSQQPSHGGWTLAVELRASPQHPSIEGCVAPRDVVRSAMASCGREARVSRASSRCGFRLDRAVASRAYRRWHIRVDSSLTLSAQTSTIVPQTGF